MTDYCPRTLKHDLKTRGRLPPAECVEIGLALTTALAHLHTHDLVHRDIKPSNIIFVGGVPKLADIGLVTDVDASRSFVGTEGFLPPEGPGTPQADLYSLGKVLYEMSTGRDRKDYPALPLDWDTLDPAEQARLLELNEVLVKVCEADPRRRYQSAEQLRDDLALLEGGQSIRRKRAVDRRRALLNIVGATAAIAVSLTTAVALFVSRHAGQKQQQREAAQRIVQQARQSANKLTKDGFSEAVSLYHQAISRDSSHVPAYLGLVSAYISVAGWHLPPREAMPPAKWAALKAVELDNGSAEAHAWLGKLKYVYEWDWAGAEAEFLKAITLNPKSVPAHDRYAMFLGCQGRFEAARTEIAHAERLASPSSGLCYSSGLLFLFERRSDRTPCSWIVTRR